MFLLLTWLDELGSKTKMNIKKFAKSPKSANMILNTIAKAGNSICQFIESYRCVMKNNFIQYYILRK